MDGDKKTEKIEKWKCRIRKTQTTYRRNWVGKGWNTHNNQVVFMCQSSSWFHGREWKSFGLLCKYCCVVESC